MKWIRTLAFIFLATVAANAVVDREAFTFSDYDLDVRIEPALHRLSVRGKISLRNDSATPQRILALQISSSLDWRSIRINGKPAEFVSQPYASDIDHTGALTEALITLPSPAIPKETIEVEVGYDGVIVQDATRLTRIGVPAEVAKHSEWDQIADQFAAVRGIGFVVWYPVSVEAANMSDAGSVEDAIGRWKARQAHAKMAVDFEPTGKAAFIFNGKPSGVIGSSVGAFTIGELGVIVPTFAAADYQTAAPSDEVRVFFSPGQADAAKTYGIAAMSVDPITPVVGGTKNLRIFELPDSDAASYASGGILYAPLKSPITNDAMLNIVYATALESVASPRSWITEGLAHFAQVAFVEQETNRKAALDYLRSHQDVLKTNERAAEKRRASDRSLVDASGDLYSQTRAMVVWWLLKEMLAADPRLDLAEYKAADDTHPDYLEEVLEKASHRDLRWFFDDWVYNDRGLPDFRVAYVHSAPKTSNGYLVTVTIENLGDAGAEVPFTLRMEIGEISQRVIVRAKSKATVRLDAASAPLEVLVNDGSVPESDYSNNSFPIK